MVITWLGQSCFKIQSGELVIIIDPFSKEIGLTPPRFRADLALITHSHFDHSNTDSLTGEPFIIQGPGEYEIKGVYVKGIYTFHDKAQGKEKGINTVYKIEFEEINIAHLGDFGEGILRDETLDEIGDTDILMIPVGGPSAKPDTGKYTIDAEDAAKVVRQIEPRFVIPMHYKIPGLKVELDPVDQFLKEMGARNKEAQEKLTIKKKDFAEEDKTEVIVLKL